MRNIHYRNEGEVMNAIADYLSSHDILFEPEKKSRNGKYIYDFFLPNGMKGAKLPFKKGYLDIKIEGPTVIELKGRLLFDTIQRYGIRFSKDLVPNKEASSFLLLYVDDQTPLLGESLFSKNYGKDFHVLSLRQFLSLKIEGKTRQKQQEKVTYDWKKDRNQALEIAKMNLLDQDFTFFFGAGVSMSAKLPSWWKLLEGLASKGKHTQLGCDDVEKLTHICYDSSIVLGRFMRLMMETKSNEEEYYKILHDALYGGISDCSSPLISEICNLIQNRKNQVKGIITYNFDDVMERALEKVGIKNYPIFGMNQPQQLLPIYHVHGFIPYDNSQIIKSVPILSEEEYHRVYANSYNWSNVEQIHALSRTTCIFIGLSMTDPNLRRLLDIAIRDSENEARHFVFLPRIKEFTEGKVAEVKNNDAMRIQKEIFLELGLRVIWYDDYTELPTLIGMLK